MSNENKICRAADGCPDVWKCSSAIVGDCGAVAASPVAPESQDAPELPLLPEMESLADIGYAKVAEGGVDGKWDEDYRNIWQKLQVAERNKMQWRGYALDLRGRLAAQVARPLPTDAQRKTIEFAIMGLRDGWATRKDADDALAILAAVGALPVPAAQTDACIANLDQALGWINNYPGGLLGAFGMAGRLQFVTEQLRAGAALPAPVVATGELAEMEARKDAAYYERNQVVAALAKCFPSGVARTAIEGWSEDWHGCVYIDLPTGQASWHFHDSQAHLFAGIPAYAGTWDGHDTPEKYRRLAALQAVEVARQPDEPSAEMVIMADRRAFHEWFNGTMYSKEAEEAMLIGWQARAEFATQSGRPDESSTKPVARLQAEVSDRPFSEGKTFYGIVVLDRARCFDGAELYLAAPSSQAAPTGLKCEACDGKGGWVTAEWTDPVSGPECEGERCGDCEGTGRVVSSSQAAPNADWYDAKDGVEGSHPEYGQGIFFTLDCAKPGVASSSQTAPTEPEKE